MNVTDILETVAILDDSRYLMAAKRMARATDDLGNTRMAQLASGLTVAGGLLTGLGVMAVKTASHFQQMQMSLDTLYGKAQGDAMFASLKKFTFSTPYTTSDWADQTRMLAGFKVQAQDMIPVLKDLGDAVTAGNGVDPQKLAQAAYAYGEMNIGFANMRHVGMFMRAHIDAIGYIEKYLGLSEQQVATIGKLHIPGKYVNAAILEGIENDPGRHDAMIKFMPTLKGEASNLNDAWQQFLAASGSPALEPIAKAVHWLADEIKGLTSSSSSPVAGYAMLFGGPALLLAGPLVRAISLWKQVASAKSLATIAAKAEMGAEESKLPVLEKESAGVTAATSKWATFGSTLLGVASKVGIVAGAMVAAQGVVDAFHAVTSKTGGADMEFDAAYDDYRRNRGAAAGDSLWHLPRTLAHAFTGGFGGGGSFQHYDNAAQKIISASKDGEAEAAYRRLMPRIENVEKNWAKVPWTEVQDVAERLHTIVDNARNYSDYDARADAQQKAAEDKLKKTLAGFDKSQYTSGGKDASDAMADTDLTLDGYETMMKIAQLDYEHDKSSGAGGGMHKGWTGKGKGRTVFGSLKDGNDAAAIADLARYNKYRELSVSLAKKEEDGWARIAAQIEKSKGHTKKYYQAMAKVLSYKEKEAQFRDASLGKDKKDAMDKLMSKIISSAGVTEQDAIKMGVNRRLFASVGGSAKSHASALASLGKRVMHVHVSIGGKEISVIAKTVEDDVLRSLAQLLEGSGGAGMLTKAGSYGH